MPWHIKLITLYLCLSACVCVKLLQSCLTLCDSMDCSLPGFSVHEIFQARILEWVAMPSSRGLFLPRGRTLTLASLELAGGFFTISDTWEAPMFIYLFIFKVFIEHITILLLCVLFCFLLLLLSLFLASENLLYDLGSSSLVFCDKLERRVEWSGSWDGCSRWTGHMCTSG